MSEPKKPINYKMAFYVVAFLFISGWIVSSFANDILSEGVYIVTTIILTFVALICFYQLFGTPLTPEEKAEEDDQS